jgi:hypothetical protein
MFQAEIGEFNKIKEKIHFIHLEISEPQESEVYSLVTLMELKYSTTDTTI